MPEMGGGWDAGLMQCHCQCKMCLDMGSHLRSWVLGICHGTVPLDVGPKKEVPDAV